MLLAVGDPAFDEKPSAKAEEPQFPTTWGVAGDATRAVRWPRLPATREEIAALREFAGPRRAVFFTGREATADHALEELAKARWAVFATHGFFADAKLRSALQIDAGGPAEGRRTLLLGAERTTVTTVVGRNPLLLSGLVFAGANLPRPKDELGIPQGDGGILTAEVIASLPLDNLELAVLSACDTGLGEVAGGEGVFGLQRAFHQAGAGNVVASLWKIDDSATAALMRLFYFKLFRENKSPLAALREAQLTIYHHPEYIGRLASARAPDFGQAINLVDVGKSAAPSDRAATHFWAGFVLSGPGM